MRDEALLDSGSQSCSAVQALLDEHAANLQSLASYLWTRWTGQHRPGALAASASALLRLPTSHGLRTSMKASCLP